MKACPEIEFTIGHRDLDEQATPEWPGCKRFLQKEGGRVRWHAEF